MKKSIYIALFFIILIIGVIVFFFYKNVSNKENPNTEISRTSTETNNASNQISENNNESKKSTVTNKAPIEEDLASFSTKIYSKKDASRQKNLGITASKLNEKLVEPGETFSFTSTVGRATPEEGYEKADIYDEHGNKVKGYGGGNCQISSTLYNVVLQLPSLQVTERNKKKKKVPYVETGKDAAVAYGSVDFKFVNNYEFPIKIYCSVDKDNVSARIVSIK